MQLKLECSCGANTYWNGENNHTELEFAKTIHKAFTEHHKHCCSYGIQADDGPDKAKEEFLAEEEMNIDDDRWNAVETMEDVQANRDLIRELEDL